MDNDIVITFDITEYINKLKDKYHKLIDLWNFVHKIERKRNIELIFDELELKLNKFEWKY